jgi:hypothetical protein
VKTAELIEKIKRGELRGDPGEWTVTTERDVQFEVIVGLPAELGDRLHELATQRGQTLDALATEILTAVLDATEPVAPAA